MARPALEARRLPTELLWNLTLRELRGKFKRSALGWLWSVINPLASIAIYTVVFGVFFEVDTPVGDPSGLQVYGFFLVCGLLPWTFLANGLNGATGSIVGNEGLVKKVYFPRAVLPAASVLAWLASYGVELAVLGVVLLVVGNFILPWVPVVVVLMLLQAAFVLGIGLMLSAANAYFRDVQHFLSIALNVWFYTTPIIYPPDLPPEESTLLGVTIPVRSLLQLNPMAIFVDAYRDVLYDLRWPALTQWLAMTLIALVALVAGTLVFRRLEPRLAEEM
jgi:lipopolysaccharide transport system permease protein